MKPQLSRRSALGRLAGTTAGLATLASVSSSEAAITTLKGRIRHSVCKWCYGKIPLEELCTAAKDIGLQSVELLETQDFPTLKKHGLVCAMVSGVPVASPTGSTGRRTDRIVAFFEKTAPKSNFIN